MSTLSISSPAVSTCDGDAAPVSVASEKMKRNEALCGALSDFCLPGLTSEKPGLSERQQQAINLLVSGCTVIATAKALRVSRGTVDRWKNRDPQFAAELDRRQREVWEQASNRLRTMSMRALSLMDAGLSLADEQARIRFAFRFLGRLFTLASPKVDGERKVIDIVDDAIREQRRVAGKDPAAPIAPSDRSAMLAYMASLQSEDEEKDDGERDWY